MAKSTNNKREEMYKEQSRNKFEHQKKLLLKPNAICFCVELVLFIILMIMDGPSVIFDNSSRLFSIMLLFNTLIPLVSIIIAHFATTTTHLLFTFSLNQICVIPLLIAYFLKYEDLKNCSSYNMLIFYFLFMIVYLAMTTVIFNIKTKFSTLEEK